MAVQVLTRTAAVELYVRVVEWRQRLSNGSEWQVIRVESLFSCLYCIMCAQVIEIGQVGGLRKPQPSSSASTLYAHSQKGGSYGDAADIVSALSTAAQQEAATAQVRFVQHTMAGISTSYLTLPPETISIAAPRVTRLRHEPSYPHLLPLCCVHAGYRSGGQCQQPRHPTFISDVLPTRQRVYTRRCADRV